MGHPGDLLTSIFGFYAFCNFKNVHFRYDQLQYTFTLVALSFYSKLSSLSLQDRDNQFPNRDCQQGALLRETVLCNAMTSGFVSDLFTVRLDDKGQTMLVISLQFTLS